MAKRTRVVLASLFLFCLGLVGLIQGGCDGLPGSGSEESGMLTMLITDKPFPFEFIAEATVTITRVEVRAGESDDSSDDDTDEAGDNDNAGEDNANENVEGDDAEENENDNAVDDDNENDNDADDDADNENENENENDADDGADNENDNDADDDNDNGAEDQDGDENENDNEAGDGNDDAENDDADDDDDGDDDGGSSLVTVLDAESTFNLLELQNGITAPLLNSLLPAGSYTQVRLIVSSGKVVLTDGREFELNVPSGEQTGIKLHFQFEIEPDEDTTLLLDVDLSKAFKPVPGGQIDDPSQIEMFQFSPSLAVRVTEVEQTGTISGAVRDEQGNALVSVSVTAFRSGEEITSTSTTEEGTFELAGLEPGDYEVEFSQSGFTDQKLLAIAVAAGQDSDGGQITLVVEAAGP